MTDPAGALLFARYAYPPNALGLCGADSPRLLLEHGAAGEADEGLAEQARTFDGAWPYLTLIAGANGIADPLDRRVVEAYWVGNRLLEQVDARALARHVDDRFAGRIGRAREHVFDAVGAGAVAHHCFHVFAVYPWLGLLRTGVVEEPLHVLDSCRIAPAVVRYVDGGHAGVLLQPLRWDGAALRLGTAEERRVRWSDEGLSFAAPEPGDRVALHWGFVCDVLTDGAAQMLGRVTRRSLRAVNARASVAAALR